MKVALITDGIWPIVIGGMQKHSYYVCKFLAQNKIYVDLYHTGPSENETDISAYFSKEELKYIRAYFVPTPSSDRFPGHYMRMSIKYSEDVLKLLRQNAWADLIYAKGLTSWSILKAKAKGEVVPPVCINVHGYEYYQKSASFTAYLQQLLLRPAFKFINERADYIYSYGSGITAIIEEHIGSRKGKIIEIPTGIDEDYLVERVKNVNKVRQFAFVGRYETRKGISELNKAIIELATDNDFIFHFIGDIPSETKIALPSVIYHGQIRDKSKIQALLRQADVLVCPSYAEGMPNVILEGMASGCAIIASQVGAVSELVTHDNGWLITPGSIVAIKNAIIEATSIPSEELLNKKLNSLKRVRQNFLWSDVIIKLIESFRHILETERRVLA